MKPQDGTWFSPEMEAFYEAHRRDKRAGCLAGLATIVIAGCLLGAIFVAALVASLGWHLGR